MASRTPSPESRAPNLPVSLGDKFALTSGLLEITYDTGAKVILQGPVTYEVESAASGFLSLGKLTARVEKKVASGQWPAVQRSAFSVQRSSNPQSPIPNPSSLSTIHYPLSTNHYPLSTNHYPLSTNHYPLFTVRTPTTTVTDLGTEFGVEVSKEGLTRVHVLQGAVETQCRGPSGAGQQSQRVAEGHAVEVARQGDVPKAVAFAPQLFARNVPAVADDSAEAAYIQAVLADRPSGYWPLNELIRWRTFHDRSGHGFHGYAMNKVQAGQPGPFGGKSRAVALGGDAYIDMGYHDEFVVKDNFTVEAWLWIDNPLQHSTVFSAVGRDDGGTLGWSLCAYSPQSFGTVRMGFMGFHSQNEYPQATSFLLPEGSMPQHQWTHVAMVYDRNKTAHLYRNGQCVESKHRDVPVRVGPAWLSIGWLSDGHIAPSDQYYWRGRLAHVAVYPQALGAERIQEHYLQQTTNTVGNGK